MSYLASTSPRISPRVSPRESPRISLDSARKRARPRDYHMPLFLLTIAVALAAATADLHKNCTLTGCKNELKHPLFILICLVTFLVGPT